MTDSLQLSVKGALPAQKHDQQIQIAIETYLQARSDILALGREVPGRIGGNDNIIGRIGEFIGLRFLEALGQRPEKVKGASNLAMTWWKAAVAPRSRRSPTRTNGVAACG